MEYKQYYRKSLEQILNQYITPERYGDFAPIFQEIFQRRAYEFEFSDVHMEKEARNFIDKMKNAKIVSGEGFVAKYEHDTKELVINRNYLVRKEKELDTNVYSKLFNILTHESYHAIALRDDDDCTGLTYHAKNDEYAELESGVALNEVFTEMAAARTCISRTAKDAENYSAETRYYQSITFVPNLLAASFGVSEKEILKAGIQSRNELQELFKRSFQDKKAVIKSNQQFQSFENCFDALYNNYRSQSQESQDLEINKFCLKEMYSSIYKITSLQIENDKREISNNTTAELVYRYNKIEKIINHSLDKLIESGQIKPEDKNEILEDILANKKLLYAQVNGIYELEKQSYKIPNQKDKEELFLQAKQGNIYHNVNELWQNYGINILTDKNLNMKDKTKNLAYDSYVLKEDYDNGKIWNNQPIEQIIKQAMEPIYEKEKQRNHKTQNNFTTEPVTKVEEKPNLEISEKRGGFKKIAEILKNITIQIKNRKQKKLPLPPNEVDEKHDNTNLPKNPWKVPNEKITPMDVVRQEQQENRKYKQKDKEQEEKM